MTAPSNLIEEFVIPKAAARAFVLEAGRELRVEAHEGPQVADIRFLNAHDHGEEWSSWLSIALNRIAGTGGMRRLTHLYSKLPYRNLMLTVVDDEVAHHQFYGNCNPAFYELHGHPGHANCFELFGAALEPFGVAMAELESASVFNVFMPVRYNDDADGTYEFGRPTGARGDSITFRAEMDVLVAATSCPEETIVNDYEPKAMRYQILDAEVPS